MVDMFSTVIFVAPSQQLYKIRSSFFPIERDGQSVKATSGNVEFILGRGKQMKVTQLQPEYCDVNFAHSHSLFLLMSPN